MAFLGGFNKTSNLFFPELIQWLCLFRNMLLISAFRHLGNKDIAKRSTQRWRSLVVSLEASNIFCPELIQWLCLFRNMLLVSAFRHLDRKDVVKRSTRRWRSLVGLLETSYIFFPRTDTVVRFALEYVARFCVSAFR